MNISTLCSIVLQRVLIFMDDYEVKIGNETVGHVTMEKQGLYYKIRCSCRLTGAIIYRLAAKIGKQIINIGICAPKGKYFCVERKLPTKLFGEETPVFSLIPKHEPMDKSFVPLRADEPFAYICELQNAYLENRDGDIYIAI